MTETRNHTEHEHLLTSTIALGESLRALVDAGADYARLLANGGQDELAARVTALVGAWVETVDDVWEQVLGTPLTMTRALAAAGIAPAR